MTLLHNNYGEINRDKWEFEYTAAKLADAAKKQRQFRLGRAEAWKSEYEKVMEDIRAKGLKVSTSLSFQKMSRAAATYANNVGGGAHIEVDSELESHLNECISKMEQHTTAAESYEGWIQMLSAHPESRMKLRYNDWMYFFGRLEKEEDE